MHRIVASANIQELSGVGEEWLLAQDGKTIIAVFFDGNFVRAHGNEGNTEDTVLAA